MDYTTVYSPLIRNVMQYNVGFCVGHVQQWFSFQTWSNSEPIQWHSAPKLITTVYLLQPDCINIRKHCKDGAWRQIRSAIKSSKSRHTQHTRWAQQQLTDAILPSQMSCNTIPHNMRTHDDSGAPRPKRRRHWFILQIHRYKSQLFYRYRDNHNMYAIIQH